MAGRRRRRRSSVRGAPGWAWMLFGLGLGLAVAAVVYIADRRPGGPSAALNPGEPPVPMNVTTSPAGQFPGPGAGAASGSAAAGAAAGTASASAGTAATASGDVAPPRFQFYEMLPRLEVVLPETEPRARPDRTETAPAEPAPGRYVLQAGSFSAAAEAEAMRANLALLGVESWTQSVTIDAVEYHRVRIGPTDDLEWLNGVRNRLWEAEIEVLQLPD